MNPFDALTELQGRDRRRSLNPYAVIALQNPSLGLNPPPGQPPKEALQNWYRTPALHANPFANHPDLQPVRQLAQEVLDNADITTEPDDTWFARLGMPDLAAERTPPPRDITAIARAFETHLERNFLYTLDLQPADPSLDPIVDFITNTQRGHCEYFASALAGLLRAANINARVVLGYVATEYDPVEEAFVVRERHAHAWVEAETAPGVWRTFDPSPRASTQQVHTPEPTLFDGVRRWFDRAETLWIRSVVSFDQDNQAAIFGMQQDGSFEPPDWIASLFDGDATADEQSGALTTLTRSAVTILLTVLVVAAATIAVYAASKRTAALIATLRARREQHADNPIPDPPFYTETLRALRDAQLTKPDATPPRAHADRIAPANPDAARLLKRIADLYYTARFAQRPLSPEQQQHATTLLTQLRQTLNPPESPRTDHASTA
jgi:transglutaminase-like putative cysteine protease